MVYRFPLMRMRRYDKQGEASGKPGAVHGAAQGLGLGPRARAHHWRGKDWSLDSIPSQILALRSCLPHAHTHPHTPSQQPRSGLVPQGPEDAAGRH